MDLLCWLAWLSGAYPLWRAWRANRATSLFHTVHWAIAAWLAWGVVTGTAAFRPDGVVPAARYLALAVTGCAGVAVLGARRPGAGAWNFVVAGLLAVLLLPLAEGWLSGAGALGAFRLVFLSATLAVGVLNYLPTRLAPSAVLLGLACGLQTTVLFLSSEENPREASLAWLWLALVPWVAWAGLRRPPAPVEFDRLWLDFRDRFGFVWGQRLREQFNRSAVHAGWPVILRWHGLRRLPGAARPAPEEQAAMVATLRALMKRFGPKEPADV